MLYSCTDPATGAPKDIVYLLTVRVTVTLSDDGREGEPA